jgi:hypothetical protein
MAGCKVTEERTSSGLEVLTRIGYHGAGRLSREIFTYLAQDFFNTLHHQDTKTPSNHRATGLLQLTH